MPNGHGGSPRFFSALILLVCLIIVYSFLMKGASPWLAWAGYPLAALFGWRFAHGLHLWKVTEYDGAYSSEEAVSLAVNKYLIGTVAYAVVAMVVWFFLT
jgi:hypothetical protein